MSHSTVLQFKISFFVICFNYTVILCLLFTNKHNYIMTVKPDLMFSFILTIILAIYAIDRVDSHGFICAPSSLENTSNIIEKVHLCNECGRTISAVQSNRLVDESPVQENKVLNPSKLKSVFEATKLEEYKPEKDLYKDSIVSRSEEYKPEKDLYRDSIVSRSEEYKPEKDLYKGSLLSRSEEYKPVSNLVQIDNCYKDSIASRSEEPEEKVLLHELPKQSPGKAEVEFENKTVKMNSRDKTKNNKKQSSKNSSLNLMNSVVILLVGVTMGISLIN